MKVIRLTPLARVDLDEIWSHTAKTWGREQAEAYLLGMNATMQLLAKHPKLGRNIDDIRQGYFKFPAASHILIFRMSPEAMEIIRILHKSMDVERHLPKA
jgi:toxin ParE1/3/4